MKDYDWHVTEQGTVVRSYFHAAGAAREMQFAQEHGWDVREVKLNGEVIPENAPSKWWQLSQTRVVRDSDGRVRLRARGLASSVRDWHQPGRGAEAFNLEVTYVRD